MKLFNAKTVRRYASPVGLPEDHAKILTEWRDLIHSGRLAQLKEVSLHGDFRAKILEGVLGFRGPTGAGEYSVSSEQQILRGSVDLAIGRFGNGKPSIIAPLELKGAKTKDLDAIMPGRNKSPVQQAWEYATGVPGVKWVLVSNYLEVRMYGFGEGIEAYESFDLARLVEPAEYARFVLLLSADNLLSGRTLDLLAESRREDRDITDALYGDYKSLRSTLIEAVRDAAPEIDPLDAIRAGQVILDRILFIAFAEDNNLLPRNVLARAFEQTNVFAPQPVWMNFKGLFTAIDKGNAALAIPRYNGGLFGPDPQIDALLLPNPVCEGFKTLGEYDFASEVSVTVLGHIFEQSIADVERLQAIARGEEPEADRATGTSGRRKRDGVVYTPDYIARFIVSETLGTHLRETFSRVLPAFTTQGTATGPYEFIRWKRRSAEREAWEAYRDRLQKLRIVDPACGSGVFLVAAFDFLKAELKRVNDKIAELSGTGQYGLFDPDSEILANNLYGVDVNGESVEIAKLSLWIKTARRGKVLDSLDASIKVGDSLIEDSSFAYLSHGFSWATAFPEVWEEGGFDVVLGNPPYVRMEHLKAMKPYLEKRFEVVSDRADLYSYFFERGLKLLKPGGRLGFISSSTFFKTGSGSPLRMFLVREATLETVVDFGDLQVFENVTTYPAILTMRRERPAADHELNFWKLDKMPDQNFGVSFRDEASQFPQSSLGAASWELEAVALSALRAKIRTGRPKLNSVYGSPMRGVVTGLNEAFVIGSDIKDALCAADPKSAELLRPFLEGKDLRRWRAETRGQWIIYIPKDRVQIDDYPAIRDWLLPFKKKLEARATKQEWFELQQAQEAYATRFTQTKISYPHFNEDRGFSLETAGAFSNDKSYFIPSGDLFLLALLNSSVAWFIVSNLAPAVRGGYHELRVQFVDQIPIPEASDEQKAALSALAVRCQDAAAARLKLQQQFRRRLPDLCPAGRNPKLTRRLAEWWKLSDFGTLRAELLKAFKQDIPLSERNDWQDWFEKDRAEISRLSAVILAAEGEINENVYALFDLTPAEIALLDAAIS
jgi:hypothetical protein